MGDVLLLCRGRQSRHGRQKREGGRGGVARSGQDRVELQLPIRQRHWSGLRDRRWRGFCPEMRCTRGIRSRCRGGWRLGRFPSRVFGNRPGQQYSHARCRQKQYRSHRKENFFHWDVFISPHGQRCELRFGQIIIRVPSDEFTNLLSPRRPCAPARAAVLASALLLLNRAASEFIFVDFSRHIRQFFRCARDASMSLESSLPPLIKKN